MLELDFIADQYGITTNKKSDFYELYEATLRCYHRRTSGPLPNETVSLIYGLTRVIEPEEEVQTTEEVAK